MKLIRLTRKQEFCLRRLSEGDACGFSLSSMAASSGDNKVRCKFEWADAPLRELRNAGLVELTGQKTDIGRRVHRITQAGREAIQ